MRVLHQVNEFQSMRTSFMDRAHTYLAWLVDVFSEDFNKLFPPPRSTKNRSVSQHFQALLVLPK